MPIVTATAKGQVLVPAGLRKRIGLKPGAKVLVTLGDQGTVTLRPIPADPIEAACGFLKGGTSLTKALLEERRKDRQREEAKAARLLRPDGLSRKRVRVRNGSRSAA